MGAVLFMFRSARARSGAPGPTARLRVISHTSIALPFALGWARLGGCATAPAPGRLVLPFALFRARPERHGLSGAGSHLTERGLTAVACRAIAMLAHAVDDVTLVLAGVRVAVAHATK